MDLAVKAANYETEVWTMSCSLIKNASIGASARRPTARLDYQQLGRDGLQEAALKVMHPLMNLTGLPNSRKDLKDTTTS